VIAGFFFSKFLVGKFFIFMYTIFDKQEETHVYLGRQSSIQ
jgi:hypothetical protein